VVISQAENVQAEMFQLVGCDPLHQAQYNQRQTIKLEEEKNTLLGSLLDSGMKTYGLCSTM